MPSKHDTEKIVLSPEVRAAIFLVTLVVIIFVLTGSWRKPTQDFTTITIPTASTNAISDREIVRGDISKRQVIFTFDGGDGSESSMKVLQVLAKHNVKGSFFLTGKFVEANQDLVRSMALLGHEVYNHTYSHLHLPKLNDDDIDAQMKMTEEVLKRVANIDPKPYMRAPYGDRDGRVLKKLFKDGYQSVYWTVDAMDWEESNGQTAKEVKERILMNLAPGNIYLMHLGDNLTGQILDEVFTNIESKGFKIVSLKEGV